MADNEKKPESADGRENASVAPPGKSDSDTKTTASGGGTPPKKDTGGKWAAYLAINSSTGALLGAILLVCLGSELWGPFIPKYMEDLMAPFKKGGPIGGEGLLLVLAIGVYGSFRDLLEAVNYFLGGWFAGRFNTRRGLLLFNAAPLIGLVIMLLWKNPVAIFLAVPFVFVWDSLAGPALLTVVGDSLPTDRRAMAFSLQSLLRRLSRIIAYGVNAGIVLLTGTEMGMEIAFAISIVVVLASLVVQWRFMKTASRDKGTVIDHPLKMLRSLDPQLKRLLVADIMSRWAEGTPRELLIIFGTSVFMATLSMAKEDAWALYGGMLIVSQVTSALTYLPMGAIASRPGFGKRPYIGWTFFFFASFPAVFALTGWLASAGAVPAGGIIPLLGVAFVFMGMREIGEPARKAMIVDLIPPAQKTQLIGLYWSARSVSVMLAPILGAGVWVGANLLAGRGAGDPSGPGPYAMLLASSLLGASGVVYYYLRFGRGVARASCP